MIGTEGEEGGLDSGEWSVERGEFLHGVQNAGRVIHHPIGIGDDPELLFQETLTDGIGKAGAYKKQRLTRSDLKIGFGNVNYRPKIHLSTI